MYKQLVDKTSSAGMTKIELYEKSKLRYLIAGVLAGFFVGLGIILIFTISGLLTDSPATKIVMGMSFGIALSLVIMAGSELFTGNIYVLGVSTLDKKTKIKPVFKSLGITYVGNLLGSILVAAFFVYAGLGGESSTGEALANVAAAKVSAGAVELIFRGILCNILVCLAVLCSIKLQSESGKLIMIWWCLFAFITSGFEHSIANMTIFAGALIAGGNDLTIAASGYNLLFVTIGNIIGGLLVAFAYYYIGSLKGKDE